MAWAYNTHDDTLTWGPKIAIVSMSFTGGSLFVMLARLYVRAFLVRALGYGTVVILSGQARQVYTANTFIDDLLIFISWVWLILFPCDIATINTFFLAGGVRLHSYHSHP